MPRCLSLGVTRVCSTMYYSLKYRNQSNDLLRGGILKKKSSRGNTESFAAFITHRSFFLSLSLSPFVCCTNCAPVILVISRRRGGAFKIQFSKLESREKSSQRLTFRGIIIISWAEGGGGNDARTVIKKFQPDWVLCCYFNHRHLFREFFFFIIL